MEDNKALKLVEPPLNERQRQFCIEFVEGKHAGNATRSYMESYSASSVSSAGSCAAQLLRDPRVAGLIAELRQQRAAKRITDMRPWEELVGEAQRTLVDILRGEVRSRLMLDACREVLDRALGKAPQRLEHELLRDENQVNQALAALAQRRLTDGSEATAPSG